MSPRRALAACALALVMPASLLLTVEPGSATETTGEAPTSTSVSSDGTQRIRLEALPQIVQQGGRVASADAARAAITATIRPVAVGRNVRLQVLRGSFWQTVARVRQNAKGRAQFAAPASLDGEPLTYRVRAASYDGLAAIISESVSTARWSSPTWTDEFSGATLSSLWRHRGQTFEGESARRCSKGDPKAVRVAEGAVRLSVIRDRTRTDKCKARVRGKVAGEFAYRLNGHIGTERAFSFTYGVAAARMKLHHLRGQHGSFWMQPEGGMYPGAAGHEIDVIEYFGDNHPRGGMTSFVHRYEGTRLVRTGARITDFASFLKNKRDGWSKNYHVFSVQWTPQTLIFRIDGKETTRISGDISSAPQFPILSLLASDYEIPHMLDRQLPQHMYVDWIRVWETGS